MITSLFTYILFLMVDEIPIKLFSPTYTFPPVTTPGEVLEKLAKKLS